MADNLTRPGLRDCDLDHVGRRASSNRCGCIGRGRRSSMASGNSRKPNGEINPGVRTPTSGDCSRFGAQTHVT